MLFTQVKLYISKINNNKHIYSSIQWIRGLQYRESEKNKWDTMKKMELTIEKHMQQMKRTWRILPVMVWFSSSFTLVREISCAAIGNESQHSDFYLNISLYKQRCSSGQSLKVFFIGEVFRKKTFILHFKNPLSPFIILMEVLSFSRIKK